jgi:hypothetical protein
MRTLLARVAGFYGNGFQHMSPADYEALRPYMTDAERAEFDRLLSEYEPPLWEPLAGPQSIAYASQADVIGFGGAAGGGKTDLAIGKALTQHQKCIVVRKNGTEHVGMVDRMGDLLGTRDGWSSKDAIWRLPKVQVEFGSVPNLGDEQKYRGRPHDLIIYDEAAEIPEIQIRFLMAWNRTTDPKQKCQTLLTFNPPSSAEGRWLVEFFGPWLDRKYPGKRAAPGELRWFATVDGRDREVADSTPFEHNGELIIPRSRTFIPSRVTDNPYLVGTNYVSQLQALPEPLRSQMLYGSFDNAPMHIDVIGVGSSPYDFLNNAGLPALGVNVSEAARGVDKSGRLRFFNLRTELYWRMREALDPAANNGIALPPDKQLLADLCAPKWRVQGKTVQVESREDIVKRIGRSPDYASAYILALIDTPKIADLRAHTGRRDEYDPYAYSMPTPRRTEHNPYG